VTASVIFDSMKIPAAADDCSEIDESERQLLEELADGFAFDEPSNFWEERELSNDKAGSVPTGTHNSASSQLALSTAWEGSIWVKCRPLARTTSKPPRWCAVLAAHELKIYDCHQEHMHRTRIPWKTVCSDEVTYAGCTDVSVQLQGRKQKRLQIAATDAHLGAVDAFVRSVRERTSWQGSVLLLLRSKATRVSKYCSCEIEVSAASDEHNRSDATGGLVLIVRRVDKKTKQTSIMDMGIGDSPVISQITTEGISICLHDGSRLRISAGRTHTEAFWDALSNGLCAPWLCQRTQGGARGVVAMQTAAFYRVEAETVAVETHSGDHNGAVFHRGDLLQCWESAISAQGTRRILTDGGWVPTPALSLVRN
jgi:hypothetical protein